MTVLGAKKNKMPMIQRGLGGGDYVKARRKWNPTREQILDALRKSSKRLKRKVSRKKHRA